MQTLYGSRAPREPQVTATRTFAQSTSVLMETAMINWPEMLRHAEDWANGFFTGATTVSLIGVAGTAFVLLVHAI